jgi:hypothetical protein
MMLLTVEKITQSRAPSESTIARRWALLTSPVLVRTWAEMPVRARAAH